MCKALSYVLRPAPCPWEMQPPDPPATKLHELQPSSLPTHFPSLPWCVLFPAWCPTPPRWRNSQSSFMALHQEDVLESQGVVRSSPLILLKHSFIVELTTIDNSAEKQGPQGTGLYPHLTFNKYWLSSWYVLGLALNIGYGTISGLGGLWLSDI